MRSGQNPAKFVETVARPMRVTVIVVSYVPFLAGYFAEGLDVLRICLDSLRRNTPEPYDLMVFDNGSAPEVVSFLEALHRAGQIEYLLLSRANLGKGGAWDIAFQAAPGEIVAYADGDVFFDSGWLSRGLKILETFPRVGMVSSRPLRTEPELTSATLKWVEGEDAAEVERGRFIPWEVFREHDVNLGQDEKAVRDRYESTDDILIRYREVEALAGAVHWQFVAYRDVLRQHLPLSLDRPMGQVRALDRRLNENGYLRLMTTEALVRHMGNTVPDDLRSTALIRRAPRPDGPRLLDWAPLRRLLLAVHNQIFRWYFRS
ncbi:MAG TPA: glycosyltransferase family 2 protein [Anaerolineales bacterium]|nr:glycosyltransferase family 2 protein [Anaerolineales bacterium]